MKNRFYGMLVLLFGLMVIVAALFGNGSAGTPARVIFSALGGALFIVGVVVNLFLGGYD